jgi:hypothetical protein
LAIGQLKPARARHQLLNYQITQLADLNGALVLSLHVARFAAGAAVILAVFAQANVMLTTAKPAVLSAGAAPFHLVAKNAEEIFRHDRSLP